MPKLHPVAFIFFKEAFTRQGKVSQDLFLLYVSLLV